MTQPNSRSLLGQDAYRNPRYAEDAAKLEAHDKATQEANAQSNEGDAQSEQPVHNWEKRYKDLQSYNSRKINELTAEIKTLKTQQVPKVQAPRTPEEMEAFKAQNPEMFAVIQHMATEIAKETTTAFDQQLATVQNDLLDTKMERAELAIKQAHPDYEAIINSQKFADWASMQSPTVQDWIYNNPDNPDLAIKALSLFKYESGMSNEQDSPATNVGADEDVNARAHAHTETESRNHPAKIWKESEIARMHPKEFAQWEETITLAHREGRVLLGQ